VGSDGNVYVADSTGNRIRKYGLPASVMNPPSPIISSPMSDISDRSWIFIPIGCSLVRGMLQLRMRMQLSICMQRQLPLRLHVAPCAADNNK